MSKQINLWDLPAPQGYFFKSPDPVLSKAVVYTGENLNQISEILEYICYGQTDGSVEDINFTVVSVIQNDDSSEYEIKMSYDFNGPQTLTITAYICLILSVH